MAHANTKYKGFAIRLDKLFSFSVILPMLGKPWQSLYQSLSLSMHIYIIHEYLFVILLFQVYIYIYIYICMYAYYVDEASGMAVMIPLCHT